MHKAYLLFFLDLGISLEEILFCPRSQISVQIKHPCLLKAGEDNPQAREEGKLYLLRTEHSSSLTGILGMCGLEFHGKATAFASPYQPEHHQCTLSVVTELVPSFPHS